MASDEQELQRLQKLEERVKQFNRTWEILCPLVQQLLAVRNLLVIKRIMTIEEINAISDEITQKVMAYLAIDGVVPDLSEKAKRLLTEMQGEIPPEAK